MNAYTRLDWIVGVLNVNSYNYGTLPTESSINMEDGNESTAEINSLLLTEISGPWRTLVIGVVEVKTKIFLGNCFCHRYRAIGKG